MEEPVVQYSFPPHKPILFWNGCQTLRVSGSDGLQIQIEQSRTFEAAGIPERRRRMRAGNLLQTAGCERGAVILRFSTGLRPAKGFFDFHTGALRIVFDGPKKTMVILRQDLERAFFWLSFFGAIPEGLEISTTAEPNFKIESKTRGAYLAFACAGDENPALLSRDFDAVEQAHTAKWAGTPWE